MNKKYWLKGLNIGIVIYILAILLVVVSEGLFTGNLNYGIFLGITAAMFIWPVILVGLIIGWIYGKTQRGTIMK